MNRIETATEVIPQSPESLAVSPSLSCRTADRVRLRGKELTPHATFAPIHYEAGYAYPLIVWLHGAGGDERQVRRVIPKVSMRNYVAIAPRGTRTDGEAAASYAWQQTLDDVEQAEISVFDCVELANRRFNIHPERIFLAGFGDGGTMAMRVAWNHPSRFAGAATLGGPVPLHNRPLKHINELRRLPCFVASGRESHHYPESEVCRDLRLLHSAGCTVALRQYPCGDDITTSMLSDLDRWFMEIVCPAQS